MSKIGLISDVHGNYEALVAILSLFEKEKCDELIHTGDVVDIGPKSKECLELLLAQNNITLTLGNHDRDFALNEYVLKKFSHVPSEHKFDVFCSIGEALREEVKRFPLYVTKILGGKTVVFTHYAFRQVGDALAEYPFLPFVSEPTAEKFDALFNNIKFDAVFFGHKHEPCDIMGERLYVDVGSVGCHPEPTANGIIIEYSETDWSYRRVSVPYDMNATKSQMREVVFGNQLYDFYFLRSKTAKD